jgi:hypothetical protein
MRSTLIALAVTGLTGLYAACATSADVTPSVTRTIGVTPQTGLIVGNSHSYYNCGVNNYIAQFAREAALPWKARLATIGGAGLPQHNVREYLKKDKPGDRFARRDPMFDVVLLQAQSVESISPKRREAFAEAVHTHARAAREAGSEPVLIAMWPRSHRMEQTQALHAATVSVADANAMAVIPVGLAFAKSLQERPDLNLHMPDRRHPTAAGSYLYAATTFAALFKRNPEGMKARGWCEKPLNDADALHLQRVAWETVKTFYGW